MHDQDVIFYFFESFKGCDESGPEPCVTPTVSRGLGNNLPQTGARDEMRKPKTNERRKPQQVGGREANKQNACFTATCSTGCPPADPDRTHNWLLHP